MSTYTSTYASGSAVDAALDAGASAYIQANSRAEFPNGNFLSPVNQRSRVSGTSFSTTGTYFLDQIKLISGSVTWTSGTGIALNGVIKSRLEILPAWLFSKSFPVIISIGSTEYKTTLTWPSSNTGTAATSTVGGVTITIGFESYSATICGITSAYVPYITLTTSVSKTINYIYSKDPPDDFCSQFVKCQRFYQYIPTLYALGFCTSATLAFVAVPTPVPMRIYPTAAVTSVGLLQCASSFTPSTMGVAAYNNNQVHLAVTCTGLTVGAVCCLHDAVVSLSAEI